MTEDFNPFDLTTKKPVKEEGAGVAVDVPQVKATVRRVGIGPIFHSRFTRLLALVGMMVIFAFAGYSGVLWWLGRSVG